MLASPLCRPFLARATFRLSWLNEPDRGAQAHRRTHYIIRAYIYQVKRKTKLPETFGSDTLPRGESREKRQTFLVSDGVGTTSTYCLGIACGFIGYLPVLVRRIRDATDDVLAFLESLAGDDDHPKRAAEAAKRTMSAHALPAPVAAVPFNTYRRA